MQFVIDRSLHHLRSLIAAPLVISGIALIASACTSTTSPTSESSRSSTPSSLFSAGLSAQRAGNLAVAIDDYKAVVAAAPGSSTASYANYNLGDIAQLDEHDLSAATTYYRAALAVNPHFASALYNLAIIFTPPQPLIAEDEYRQVIAIDPKDAAAHLNLGLLDDARGKKTEAHEQFAAATSIDPSLASRIPAGS